MKRISRLAVIPFLIALGACSSSSKSPTQSAMQGGDGGMNNVASNSDAGDDGGAGLGNNSSGATLYAAVLSGAQVAPTAVQSGYSGTAKLALQPDNVTLTYDITQNVPSPMAVNLHIGAPLENGPTTHQLMPVSGHMTGSIMLTMDEQNALSLDQLYIDIPTQMNPQGEIRGQITLPNATIFVATPTGAQEVPSLVSSYMAHASFIMSPDMGTMMYHVATTAVPTDVRLQRAIASTNGQTVYPLTPIGQSVDGMLQLAASDPDDLAHGRFYVNIVTSANQAGELRGQLITPGETLFTGALSGLSEVPPVPSQANGGAQFILSADRTQVQYEAVVNGVFPTAAELDNAPQGKNGPMMRQLTLVQQGIQGQTMLMPGDLSKFVGGDVYMNVRTTSYTSGELRAQLLTH
jgi:hypothetical protein